jgi:hypothetical protein
LVAVYSAGQYEFLPFYFNAVPHASVAHPMAHEKGLPIPDLRLKQRRHMMR